jgi:hypothetical protein
LITAQLQIAVQVVKVTLLAAASEVRGRSLLLRHLCLICLTNITLSFALHLINDSSNGTRQQKELEFQEPHPAASHCRLQTRPHHDNDA